MSSISRTVLMVASLAITGAVPPAWAADKPLLLRTDRGQIAGVPGAGGRTGVYKSIPFAAPPIGDLRWRAPQPVRPWRGVRDSSAFSPDCMQPIAAATRAAHATYAEDCLYLNVWAPVARKERKLPVFVWIYGGTFTHGGASQPVFDGEALAERDMIVVTFNYRLGALGWLAHPLLTAESGTSGNYGLLDQIAALQWVKRNIGSFGGDASNVTVAGESAGALSVDALMAAPAARGLFARAIVQSGPIWGMSAPTRSRRDIERVGTRVSTRLGASTLEAMRAIPAEQLVSLTPEEGALLPFPFAPVVDGKVLPRSPAETFARAEEAPVPMIIGFTADEFSQFIPSRVTPQMFEDMLRRNYGDEASRLLQLYPHANHADARRAWMQSGLYQIYDGSIGQALLHARWWPTWLYRFDHVPPGLNPEITGVPHGADVAYTFDAVHGLDKAWREADVRVARQLVGYWTNLARRGDPNGQGLPEWPRVDSAKPSLLSIADPAIAMPAADLGRIKASRRAVNRDWLARFLPERGN